MPTYVEPAPIKSATSIGTLTNSTISLGGTAGVKVLGPVEFPDGTNSAPSITNTGDTNTGIFFSTSDNIDFTIGGTKLVDIGANGLTMTSSSIGVGVDAPSGNGEIEAGGDITAY